MEFLNQERIEKRNGKSRKFLLFLCECGNLSWVRNDARNTTKSCGCLQKKRVSEVNKRFITHGMSKNNRLYNIWKNMKRRCLNPNSKSFHYYGGRGVTVCDEWRNDFMAFYDWAISSGYSDILEIDRINNDGNYEPSNCRWVDHFIQTRNTRILKSNNTSGYRGVSVCRNMYQSVIGVNKKQKYIGVFKTALEAGEAYDAYIVKHGLEHTQNNKEG